MTAMSSNSCAKKFKDFRSSLVVITLRMKKMSKEMARIRIPSALRRMRKLRTSFKVSLKEMLWVLGEAPANQYQLKHSATGTRRKTLKHRSTLRLTPSKRHLRTDLNKHSCLMH